MLFEYFKSKIDCFSSTPYEDDTKYPLGTMITENEVFANISFISNIKTIIADPDINNIHQDNILMFSIIGILKHLSLINYKFDKLESSLKIICEHMESNTLFKNKDKLIDLISQSLTSEEFKAYSKMESILWKYNEVALDEWKNKNIMNEYFFLFMNKTSDVKTDKSVKTGKTVKSEEVAKTDEIIKTEEIVKTEEVVKVVMADELEKTMTDESKLVEVVDIKVNNKLDQISTEEAINQILIKEHDKIIKTKSWADESDDSDNKKSYVDVVQVYAVPDTINAPIRHLTTILNAGTTVLFTYIIEYNSTQNGISIRFDDVEFSQIKLKYININDIKYQNIDLNEKDNKNALLLSILLYAISIRYCQFPNLNTEDCLENDKEFELTCNKTENELIRGVIYVSNDQLNMRYSNNNSDIVETNIPLSYSDIIISGGVLNETARNQYGKNCLLCLKYCSTTFSYTNLNKVYVPYKEVYDHITNNGGKRSREYNYNPYKSLLSLIETVNLEYLSKDYNPYGHNYINELKIFSTFSIFKRLTNNIL